MKCPNCKTQELTPYKINGVEIHVCQSCHGFWLTKDQLEGVKGKIDNKTDAWLDLDLWNDNEKMAAKPIDAICPVCVTPLYSLDWDNSHIVIKMCKKCNGIWLDHGDMKKLIEYIKMEANAELLNEYGKVLKEKIKDVFTGKKGLGHEIHDVWTVLDMLQYKMMVQDPNLTKALLAVDDVAVGLPVV